MARRRRRPPEVLRRVYGDRVRSLAETLLSLLPKPLPSPKECRCRGRGCLGCEGFAFLLRHDDGPDYRRLLNHCFCVVSPDAPELTYFYYGREWTQRLIVRNTMELLLDNRSDNLLFKHYDKRSSFSLNGEFLCNSAWNLLLTRIGESAMTFLLKFSSIFIPLPTSNHYQVTGHSLLQDSDFFHRPVITSSASNDQLALVMSECVNSGCQLKRKRVKFEEKQEGFGIPDLHHSAPLPVHDSAGLIGSVVHDKPRNYFNTSSCKDSSNTCFLGRYSINTALHSYLPIWPNMFGEMAQASLLEAHKHSFIPEKHSPKNGIEYMKDNADSTSAVRLGCSISSCYTDNNDNYTPLGAPFYSTSEFSPKSRKRGRLFSWQRRRNRKKVNTLDDNLYSCSDVFNDKERSARMFLQKTAVDLNYKSAEKVRKITCSRVNQVSELVNPYPPVIAEPNRLQENIGHDEAINCENSEKLFHTDMTSTCFNCSMVQSLPKVTTRAEIRKMHMFYSSRSSSSIFPSDHILSRLKPNNSGAHALLKHIFGISKGSLNTDFACLNSNHGPAIKSGCLHHSFLRMLKTMIRNAHKCHYMKFLHRHCSVSDKCCNDDRGSTSEAHKRISKKLRRKHALQRSSENPSTEFSYRNTSVDKQKALHKEKSVECDLQSYQNEYYCRHEDVVSFLWAVTRSIVPVDLLGDSSNWRTLRKNISKFVRLRRFEKFCLRQCILGLQASKFPFLATIPNCLVCHCFNRDDSSTIKGTGKCNNDGLGLKHKVFHRWIYWFFSYMIVPILGANFYITERESGRHEVFYYSKPVWSRLVARTITCLKEQNYRPVGYKKFEQIMNSRPFGFSKVRFLPKQKGVRLLANLKAPSKAWLHVDSASGHCIARASNKSITRLRVGNCNTKAKFVHSKPVNSALRDIYAILKRIKIECPQMLGASVFDYNDIYQMLHQFLSKLKNGSTTMPNVFIVVSDVSKAFDSIDQDRLLNVMKNVIQKEEYLVRKYVQVICSKKPIRILYHHVCLDESKDNDIVNLLATVRSHSSHGVLIDQGVDRKVKQVQIHHLLREHVKSNILQLGQGFYLQKSGIAQGSLLSSLLCSFYYGHMERTIIFPFLEKTCELSTSSFKDSEELNIDTLTQVDCRCNQFSLWKQHETCEEQSKTLDLEKEDKDCIWKSIKWQDDYSERDSVITCDFFTRPRYLLLRLVDDFIFISTSKRQATSLFNRLCRGFREYNCFMNSEKFGLNFDVDSQTQPMPNRRYVGADGIPFLPWSGLLVNCQTLEVQADYTRYLGTHLRSTLTVRAHTKQVSLGEKLCNYMRPKCHPIFYDSNINSPAIVRLNVYQAFLLCAMKFHCYLCAITPSTHSFGPACCLEIIQRSFSYMHRLMKKRMYSLKRWDPHIHPVLKLKKVETVWLGLSAYIRVLTKKQSRHAKLLSLLKAELDSLGRMDCDPYHLKYAVDDSHSTPFWKIKY